MATTAESPHIPLAPTVPMCKLSKSLSKKWMIQWTYLDTCSNLIKKSVPSSVEFACIRAQLLDCDAHIAANSTNKPLSHLP